jgi:DNA repair exonuclease SbcCD ATPase subunit
VKIEELNLDVRTYNAVKRAGCTTVEELKQMISDDPDELRRNTGSSTFDRIEEMLAGMHETQAAVVVSEDYTRAVTLTRSIIANAQAAQQSLYEVCKGLKEMRDGKLYKELGYQKFEDYCENEVEIKWRQAYNFISIAEGFTPDSLQSIAKIGTTKLALLAKLDEPTRETITETVDVENTTVRELKAQITALTAERDENEHAAELLSNELDSAKESLVAKDKQFQAAMESKKRELDSVLEAKERIDKSYHKKHAEWLKFAEENTRLTERIFSLEAELKELESRPVEVAVSEAEAKEIERLTQELEAAKQELALTKKETYAGAQRIADKVRHDMQNVHKAEMQTLREGYEKQLAVESKKQDRAAIDRGKFYALKTIFEEIVDELESLLDDLHDDPRIRYINELDNYWTDNLLYLKREGEGAGK